MKITVQRLFDGNLTGGVEPESWESLTIDERISSRLRFIQSRAKSFADMPYSTESGLPANIWSEARRLEKSAEDAITALPSNPHLSAWYAIEVGVQMGRINELVAVAKAFEIKIELIEPKSQGGKTTAKLKKLSAAEKMDEAVRLWRTLKKPERVRSGIIAQRMGYPTDTVRRWIKKAGLR